jgi:hypothetical protein
MREVKLNAKGSSVGKEGGGRQAEEMFKERKISSYESVAFNNQCLASSQWSAERDDFEADDT